MSTDIADQAAANSDNNGTIYGCYQAYALTLSIPMKSLLRVEELFMAVLGFYLFRSLDYAWWWFLVLFFAPDLSMFGYLFGPKVGAWTYNLVHHKAIAIFVFVLGLYGQSQWLQAAGLILFSHSSLDRVLGYGLKYSDAFQHTHLGMIGRVAAETN